MEFQDRYPTEIEFEIDRRRLLRYWRLQSAAGCLVATLPFSLMFGIAFYKIYLESHPSLDVFSRIGWCVVYALAGIVGGTIVAGVIYFTMFHSSAKRAANNIRLKVEGPLLRKLGMKNLGFRVVGTQVHALQFVPGLVDPDDVRDQLCEIDAAREDVEH